MEEDVVEEEAMDAAGMDGDAAAKEERRVVLAMARKLQAVRRSKQARRSPVTAARSHHPLLTKGNVLKDKVIDFEEICNISARSALPQLSHILSSIRLTAFDS